MRTPPSSNPILKKLGFAPTDRVAIIHTDDIGLTHASVAAARELWSAGIISSSAVMVPCPWFLHTAQMCRANPKIDMGVHLTITSEWNDMRWGPLSTHDARSGLIDSEGYFFRSTPEAQRADPDAVAVEFELQIQRALSAGIDVTHIDSHMGTAFHANHLAAYVKLAMKYSVVPMLPRLNREQMKDWGIEGERAGQLEHARIELEDQGVPFLDFIKGMPLHAPENRHEQLFAALDSLPAGITHMIVHPSHDTPEARALSPDLPSRIGDFETLMSERTRIHIKNSGLQVIGYRELRNVMRG
jgi:hypothetical protein